MNEMKQLSSEEYKKRLLEVVLKVDKICRDNGFRYSIFYGTLLGAVRHGGFIPWDDDIDLIMPRSDYYKLGAYISVHPELELCFIDVNNHKDTIYTCGKVCDSKTVVRESYFKTVEGYGAFVDIFPFDNFPDDEKERKAFTSHAQYLARVIQHSAKLRPGRPKGFRHAVLLYAAFVYAHCFDTWKLIKKLDEYCMKYNDAETRSFGVPHFVTAFSKDDLREFTDLPFEGHMLIGPRNYDTILKQCYGDYMTPPPPEERINHLVECCWKE